MANQLRLDVAQLTDVGRKREHNEDNMAYVIPKDGQVMTKKGALFIVADGMGGHAAGEVASEIAVDTVSNAYYQDDDEDVSVSLLQAIKRANALIHQRAAENMLRSGMGTTCVAAVLRGNMAYIANVGDSRAYFIRNGQVKQISQDHSWVAEQVRAGLLTDDQARTHAQRNVITRCLGTQADVDVDVFIQELLEGDSLVLCTDGLSGLVSDDEIRRIVDQYVPQESVYHLIEQANNNGGPDNITAIVLRVLEVGVEPPGVRHPVGVGGRETGEDTAILGLLPGAQPVMAQRPIDGHVPSAPMRYSSGPLSPLAESVIAPQPVPASSARRARILYPTLAICILLIVALVGTAAFYFLHPRTDVATQSLQQAHSLIVKAQGESNAVSALQDLSHAQNMLRSLQSSTLSSDQQTALNSLQGELVSAVKNAITDYNQQSAISNLPCTTQPAQPVVSTINEGSSNAQPLSLAVVQGSKGTMFYTRASDYGLYQISSQYGLVNRLSLQSGLQVLLITGDNNRLFLLMAPRSSNRNEYRIGLLLPGQNALSSSMPLATTNQNEQFLPTLMTAWGNDLYVVLSATSSNNASNIVILDYTVSSNNKLSTSPTRTTVAASTTVTSVAAFPGRQLFLLFQGGAVQNLQLNVKNAVPTPVLVQHPLAAPLNVTAAAFNARMTVPTVTASTSAQSGNVVPLNVVGATQLTAGVVSGQNEPHLYIVDPTNRRLLDLQVGPSSLTTPTPTPTSATTVTTDNGGSVAGGSSITVALNQQYVSTSLFANLPSVVTDPKGLPIYALSKTSGASPSTLLVSLDTNACS